MRKHQFKTSFLIALLLVSGATLMAQNTFKTTSKSVIAFYQYLPKDYASNSNKYPVVIFLHGIGERGPNSTNKSKLEGAIPAVAKLGPPRAVRDGKHFPFILISPQLKTGIGNWPTWYVREVIDYVKTYLRIDEKRIHITGLSLGGGGAWTIAQESPELFASLSPVCGGYNAPAKAPNIARENLPVWAFHGDADNVVTYKKTTNMVNAINGASPTPNPRAKLTIYPGVKHDSWNRAYAPDHAYHSPNVYEWMMKQVNKRNGSNNIPTANAGSDKSVSAGSKLSLTGSGSDSDGSIVSYRWTKIGGPSASIANANSAKATISGLSEGTYYFRLQVTDDDGDTDSDYVRVTVNGSSGDKTTTNQVPKVNAGSNLTVTLPTNSVTISGSASDPDGSIASYTWTKRSGGAAKLSGANSSKLTVSGLVEGTYIFRLTVKDNKGATKFDEMLLSVKAGSNQTPVANAGPNVTIHLPTNAATIRGSGSDKDGSIASYAWTKRSGGRATLNGASTPNLKVSNLEEGTYVFRLTVKDNKGATKYDDMALYVKAGTGRTGNEVPSANAGADRVVKLPVSTYTVSGSAQDTDGSVSSYKWTQISGPYTSMSNTNSANLRVNSPSSGTRVFRLTVTDNNGATSHDDVKITFNYPPKSWPGNDVNKPYTSRYIIVGKGSDSDGSVVKYKWTKVSGPSVTVKGLNSSNLEMNNMVAGTYVWRLTVTDNHNLSHSDEIRLVFGK